MNFKSLIILLVFVLLLCKVNAQDKWVVPDDKKSMVAPFKFDAQSVKQGGMVFDKYCKSCHGTPGMHNGIAMKPVPIDPASKEYQFNTDGEIYYKMSEGRGPMPTFKTILEEEDRWEVISYIRSFNKSYIQPEPVVNEASKLKGKIVVNFVWDKDNKVVNITVLQKEQNEIAPLKGYEVGLFVKRYFGDLKIENLSLTNAKGVSSFPFPEDLPGDKEGNLTLKIKVNNEAAGISISKDTIIKMGTISKHVNMLDKREWWNVRSKAPLWLVITYSLAVIGVLAIIFHIIQLVYKVWKAGETKA